MPDNFGCQLAHDGEAPAHRKKIAGHRLLDVKLDGVRALALMRPGEYIGLFTRTGKRIETFPEIQRDLADLSDRISDPIVLDGEMTEPAGFQSLMTMLKCPDRDTSGVRYALFDMIPLLDFQRGISTLPQITRRQRLAAPEITAALGPRLHVLPWVSVNLESNVGRGDFIQFRAQAALDGAEGVMVKDPFAPYVCRRSAAWLKLKPAFEVSLEVVDVLAGEPGGKCEGVMGALLCRGVVDGRTVETSVGTGFTDEQRAEFWRDRSGLIGMVAEIRADRITLAQDSDVWSLRFPRFKGFRGTVAGEVI